MEDKPKEIPSNKSQNNIEKIKIIDDNNNKTNKNNEITLEENKKEKPKEEIKSTQPIEINPFLNPMLISTNTINNLF